MFDRDWCRCLRLRCFPAPSFPRVATIGVCIVVSGCIHVLIHFATRCATDECVVCVVDGRIQHVAGEYRSASCLSRVLLTTGAACVCSTQLAALCCIDLMWVGPRRSESTHAVSCVLHGLNANGLPMFLLVRRV